MNNNRDRIQDWKDMHQSADVYFNVPTIEVYNKVSDFIIDVLHSWRRKDRLFSRKRVDIQQNELDWRDNIVLPYNEDGIISDPKKIAKPRRPKYHCLHKYSEMLISWLSGHGNVWDHTNQLLKYLEQYSSWFDQDFIIKLRRAIIVHDMFGEWRLLDITQSQWKTDYFRQQEYYAGKYTIQDIYSHNLKISSIMTQVYEELQNKDSLLYKTLKVYEEFSHIDWLLALYKQKKLAKKHDNIKEIKTHIQKLEKRKEQYPFIQKFLNDRNWEIQEFINHYTTPNDQLSLFDIDK